MRIYVSTFAKYNDGNVNGSWLDLDTYIDRDDFIDACIELHNDEEDPELMFQDTEDIPDGYVSESSVKPELWDLVNMDEDDRELLAVYRDNVDSDGDLDAAREAFHGTFDTPADYAAHTWEETGEMNSIPETLRHHIDWEGVARDMGYEGMSFVRHKGDTWVFSA